MKNTVVLKSLLALLSLAVVTTSAAPGANDIVSPGFDAVFVPLDSWMYPALYRLADMGYIPRQFSNLGPWTRDECARQVDQASETVAQHFKTDERRDADNEALKLIRDLRTELNDKLAGDHNGLRFESLYTNFTGIAGTPLADGYHFGQTIVNNYGRPYWTGLSNDTGASAYANFGRFFIYARGEVDYAPGQPNYSLAVRQQISNMDWNPLLPASGGRSIARLQPEELYAGVQLGPENISFGNQSLWWGPGQDSAFAFSDNAAPFPMLKFDQTQAIVLPSIFRYLGKMRTQFIFGELPGHLFPRGPQMNAQKISFDITDTLEVGIERSAFWGGQGHPETVGNFFRSLFSTSSTGCSFAYGDRCDPGDRHTGFDIRWRLPGVHKYVTVYTDSYADDEVNPLANPGRSAWGPGIYISHLPHAEKLDLRFESYDTWLNVARGGQFFYFNNQYHDAYTNDGVLLGSWVGRQARAYVGTVGYWLSARTRFQAQVRQLAEPDTYLPGGGTQTDGTLMLQWSFGPQLLASFTGQAERYAIPVLGAPHNDGTVAIALTFTPGESAIH